MGGLCDLDGDQRIARDFRVEREEARSAMVATALEVRKGTALDVSPRHVRDRMVKAAFEVAFRMGSSASCELSMDDVEILLPGDSIEGSVFQTSSIIDVTGIRDAGVVERLGSGSRSGSVSPASVSRISRSWISDPSLYCYISDLYPSFIGLKEAAVVMGITESAAHRLIEAGRLPFPAARAGRGYRVSVRALMHFKNIPDVIVHVDDVENGVMHAGGHRLDVRSVDEA